MSNSSRSEEKREEKGLVSRIKSVFKENTTIETKLDTEKKALDRVIAIIDLGSNSLRLMLVQMQANNSPVVINQIKQMVRLGENSFVTKLLQEEQIEKTIEALQAIKQTCEQYNVEEVIAMATAAVRKADNAKEFVDRVYKATGIEFNIISGREEARLIYLGISTSLEHSYDLRLYIDIGGGSTEIILGHSEAYSYIDSISIGCVLVANQFMQGYKGAVSNKLFKEMQAFVKQSSIHSIKALKEKNIKEVYASSGTAKAMYEISYKLGLNKLKPEEKAITISTLKEVVQHICSISLEEREELDGVSKQRAQVLVAGAAILLTLAEELKLKKIIVTSLSLQHGILVDYLQRTSDLDIIQREKVRAKSIQGLAQNFNCEKAHSEQVARLSLMLHDSAVDCALMPYNEKWRTFLEYASILHDIGISISYTKHYKHSHYIIMNSELLGFTDSEKEIIALLAFFHNKKPSKKYQEYNTIDEKTKQLLPFYSLFLALAENLDKLHCANVLEVSFKNKAKSLQLHVRVQEESFMEEQAVRQLAKSIEKVFQKEISIYFSL